VGKIRRHVLTAIADVEMAVRLWYKYYDADQSNAWLELARQQSLLERRLVEQIPCVHVPLEDVHWERSHTYAWLAGTWPFGVVEAVWAVIALRRWYTRSRRGA